jgi:hypothetical protein
MSDYMPVNILEFVKFVHNIRTQAAANCTRWNISMAEINELDPLIAALDATVAVSENPTTRTNAAIRKREEARNALKVQLRPFIQGRLKHNLRVTNDDLISMNLSVPDRPSNAGNTTVGAGYHRSKVLLRRPKRPRQAPWYAWHRTSLDSWRQGKSARQLVVAHEQRICHPFAHAVCF